jgi:uncharacterized protein YlzI (FlbEa/FlbD family)
MNLVPFKAAKGDSVWVNPAHVTSVEPGEHYYNLDVMPSHKTLIGFGGSSVFVDVTIDEVVRRLRNYEKECQHG